MAVPKRRTSAAKRDSRRSQWKAIAPTIVECPNCHAHTRPHHACPSCGHYNKRQVIEVD